MKQKSRQLSMFTDEQVARNPLCRAFLNPPRRLLRKLRFEGVFGIKTPGLGLESWEHDNIMRHVKGGKIVKIGRRYFYD